MAIKDIHYNAFISYRHSDPDSTVATLLQRKLEAFRLPKNLRGRFPKEQWKIERVFRDQDELPLADNLSDPIEQALANSDFLIVICSPRLPESKWCAREIELFKQMHGLDHILAVLIEGEPTDSFPDGIRYKEVPSINENGETVYLRQEVEPLAADVRAADEKTRKKMIEDAVLRMAAPMYGLGYDELKQRHREQRIRRIAALSGITAAAFMIYAATSTVLALRISEQKKTIEEQHSTLQQQYLQQQEKYAESMSMVSGELLKEGRRKDALYAVRNAMPDSREDTAYPYLASTEYALSTALFVYDSDIYIPQEILPLPEGDDPFWGEFDEYRFLQDYLGDQKIQCAAEREDGSVLLLTDYGLFYPYYPDENLLLTGTPSLFADIPDRHINAASIQDDMLYLSFLNGDYMVSYQWRSHEENQNPDIITLQDVSDLRGAGMDVGDEKDSDDGKYRIRVAGNQSIQVFKGDEQKPLHTIYDIPGMTYGLKKVPGTPYYVLLMAGKYSYLLNEDFDVIARIAYYYGYDEEKKELILYYLPKLNTSEYYLYTTPLYSYEELIEMADELLTDYKPSEEILQRYRMLE